MAASPHTLRIAAAQAAPVFMNREKTVDKACRLIREAGKNKAALVLFPEAFIPGYPDWVWVTPNNQAAELNSLYVELVNNAIRVGDEACHRLCRAAKEANTDVAVGINEINSEASNASLFNSLLYISNKGEIRGVHRKLIPTGAERLVWAQGSGPTLFTCDTPRAKLGGLICWENLMPLSRQAMYSAGIQILLAPTWDKSANWQISMRHIAREGAVFVISCCNVMRMTDIPDRFDFKQLYPQGREWINPGNSCIINPKGEIIAGPAEQQEAILYADIDLNDILAAKRLFDVSGHYARPDIFTFAVKRD